MTKKSRDIEKDYPKQQFIKKIRRLADALEGGKNFSIQIAGEKITVPSNAIINVEHERSINAEEIEFQLKWSMEK